MAAASVQKSACARELALILCAPRKIYDSWLPLTVRMAYFSSSPHSAPSMCSFRLICTTMFSHCAESKIKNKSSESFNSGTIGSKPHRLDESLVRIAERHSFILHFSDLRKNVFIFFDRYYELCRILSFSFHFFFVVRVLYPQH